MNWMLERLALRPDLARALRASVAFSLALLICSRLGAPVAAQFAATTAMAASLPQLRGAYHIRVGLLLVIISIFTVSAAMGALSAGNPVAAVLGIGFLALLSGVWRHLSSDYGPAIGVDSGLLFLISLEGPMHGATPLQIATWTAIGGTGAAILHLGVWFFRPQHALRHAVAEGWVAASDLFLSMRPNPEGNLQGALVTQRQREFRETIDRVITTLAAAKGRQDSALLAHLDRMRHEAAHFSMQVSAFYTASESLVRHPGFVRLAPTLDLLMTEFANMARSISVTLITHRPENLALTEARLQTCEHLIHVLNEQLAFIDVDEVSRLQLRSLLHTVKTELDSIEASLSETVDHSVRSSSFSFQLPDLSRHSMRAIAAGLNPATTPAPELVRYAIRMSALCMIAVAIYQVFAIPRGYWMALAIIVVLQPDYGSTRQRATQRVGGTFGGAVLGSALLMAQPYLPVWLIGILACLAAFGFVYFLKRRYRLAVFFVTVMVVLVTELHAPVHLDFTIGRLLSNLAGAGLALVAALYFWPRWERENFPCLLAKAIRANSDYSDIVVKRLASGGAFDREVIHSKQKAERTGNIAAASLQRMLREPSHKQSDTTRSSSAVMCNERVTRTITVLATHLASGTASVDPVALQIASTVQTCLSKVAHAAEMSAQSENAVYTPPCDLDSAIQENSRSTPSGVVAFSLEKLSVEVLALSAALT